jgi:hypothetical protein
MVFFHALSDLVCRIQHNAPTWDFSKMSALEDLSSTWCVDLVSLEANNLDKQHGVETVVIFEDVLRALVTSTTDLVDFRNRHQSYDQLKNMLLALVSRGINLYLGNAAAHHGEGIAEMALHHLCYVGSTSFAIAGLDGRWMSIQESDKLDSKRAKEDQVIAIKYRARPKLLTELRGHQRPSSAHGSERDQRYQPHVKRGRKALKKPW